MLLQRLSTEHPVPYGPSDFPDDNLWQAHRASEITALSDLALSLMKLDSRRDRPTDRFDGDASLSLETLSLETRTLTFVPSDPRETYRQLLRVCLDHDLQVLRTLPEDQDVSLGILSAAHTSLLDECALYWRLPTTFRSWVFLEAIQEHYTQGEVPPDCVFEAAGGVGRASQDYPISDWPIPDQQSLQAVLLRRNEFFLNDIEIALGTPLGYLSLDFRQAVAYWLCLDVDDYGHPSLQRTQRSIVDRLRQQAYSNYIEEASERYSHEGGKNRAFAMSLASWIESGAKKLDKWFQEPVTP